MYNLKGKKIFVSGGAGVIGCELVIKLHKRGAVLFVGDLKPRPKEWPQNIKYFQGDLNYLSKGEVDKFGPEVFIHLAATFERSTESYEFWNENYWHNVNLSHHLLDIIKDGRRLKKIVFASSYLIYAKRLYSFKRPQGTPYRLSEEDPISPRNLTGSAKLNHEIELEFLKGFRSDIKIVLARIYRGYGRGSRDVISRWVRAALLGKAIQVFHKENIFDYIFAEDTAEGLIRLTESSYSGIVNLGTGLSQRVTEVMGILKKHFPKLKHSEGKSDDLYEASEANVDKLEKLTGWKPEISLEKGMAAIVAFEKKSAGIKIQPVHNVLVTSIAKKVPLLQAVRKAMLKHGSGGKLFGGDGDDNVIGSHFVDMFWKMPRTEDENLTKIIKYCTRNKITDVIPTRDGELKFWAKHKKTLKVSGINVMVSGQDAIAQTLDKLVFYKICTDFGFPAIETSERIDGLKKTAGHYVVKERFGAGSRSLALGLTFVEAAAHIAKLETPIVQPHINGKEYSVDVYVAKNGTVKGAVVRERNVVFEGESQITTTVSDKKLERLCSDLAHALRLYGHAVFQVLKDANGKYHIIECNARFGGASTLALATGLDSFYWFLLESDGGDLDTVPHVTTVPGVRQVRHSHDVIEK